MTDPQVSTATERSWRRGLGRYNATLGRFRLGASAVAVLLLVLSGSGGWHLAVVVAVILFLWVPRAFVWSSAIRTSGREFRRVLDE